MSSTPGHFIMAPSLVLSLLLVCTLGGCSGDKSGNTVNDMRWLESVTLASGEKLSVSRHVRFRQERALGGGFLTAAVYEAASLEITPTPKDFVPWTAPIIPILLDRDPDNGEWIVIGGDDGGILWDFNGKPCPPQWGFRLHNGVWYVQPVPTSLIGRAPNLLVDLRVTDDAEFSAEQFDVVAAERLKSQLATGDHINPVMKSVGVIASKQVQCKESEAPRFTDQFTPERTNRPNLATFPRMQ